jgi:hypothetical protein
VFAAINLVMLFFWAILLVVLISVGLFIGLIIGFVLLFFFLGYVNAGITSFIWDVEIRTDWKSAFLHGLVLFVAFVIVNIPSVVLNYVFQGIATTIVLFLVYCFIDGFVARKIAGNWRRFYENVDFSHKV